MNLTIEQIRDKYRKSKDKMMALELLASSEGVSVSTIKLYVRGVMSSVELEDMAVANGTVEAVIPAAVIPEEKPVQVITDAFVPIAKKKLGRPKKTKQDLSPDYTEGEKEMVASILGLEDTNPVIEVKTLPVIHPATVSLEEREMFFADIAEETKENRIPPVHAPEAVPEAAADPCEECPDTTPDRRCTVCELPEIPVFAKEDPCDTCKNYGDFCTSCQQHDGYEPKTVAADPDPLGALLAVEKMCWPPKEHRTASDAYGSAALAMDRLRDAFHNQAAKHDEGKPRLSLVPPSLIEAVGRVRTYGTDKYGDPDNWLTVKPWRYKDALMRHLCEYLRDPNSVDEESGIPHLEHLACNVAFLLEFEDQKKRGTRV